MFPKANVVSSWLDEGREVFKGFSVKTLPIAEPFTLNAFKKSFLA